MCRLQPSNDEPVTYVPDILMFTSASTEARLNVPSIQHQYLIH